MRTGRRLRDNALCGDSSAQRSAPGFCFFRRTHSLELFIAHPGGPFWEARDAGAWTIPKGAPNGGEDLLTAACREFEEETGFPARGPFTYLGSVRQRAGKEVHGWAWEGDADPAVVHSNLMRAEWPRGSGKWEEFPEIDRCEWFSPEEARIRLNPAQAEFVDRLEATLKSRP